MYMCHNITTTRSIHCTRHNIHHTGSGQAHPDVQGLQGRRHDHPQEPARLHDRLPRLPQLQGCVSMTMTDEPCVFFHVYTDDHDIY